jgi:hypothetical protein
LLTLLSLNSIGIKDDGRASVYQRAYPSATMKADPIP